MSLGGHLGEWEDRHTDLPECEGCSGPVTTYSRRDDLCGACTHLLEVSGIDPRGVDKEERGEEPLPI